MDLLPNINLKLKNLLCSRKFINRADVWSYCMMASDQLSYVNSQEWGYEIKYKKIALMPNLAIKNFALETPDGRITVKKWKDVPFPVQDFNFYQYCQDKYPDILD